MLFGCKIVSGHMMGLLKDTLSAQVQERYSVISQ